MIGSVSDFIRRLAQVLPTGWFGDISPIRDAVFSGFSTAWCFIYSLITSVQLLARIATASGSFLDMISVDFFGANLPRWQSETDAHFLSRIQNELLRPRATRTALSLALTELTGRMPVIFEPARALDTGAYTVGGAGYCVAGGWGTLSKQYLSFVTAFRPLGAGIAQFAGYGTGGVLAYGDLSIVATQVTDAEIYAQAAAIIPLGHTAWLQIQD